MSTLTHRLARLAGSTFLAALLVAPLQAGKLLVWVDDAHTRQVEVEEIDPDDIADPSSLGLGAGTSFGQISVSFGWKREKGIAYEERIQEVVDRLHELCKEFNAGKLSLESYQRQLRDILSALDHVRMLAMEMQVSTTLKADRMSGRMDEILGNAPVDNSAEKEAIVAALAAFEQAVGAVEQPLQEGPRSTEELLVLLDKQQVLAQGEASMAVHEQAFEARTSPRTGRPTEFIEIWKDRAETTRIRVPRLDVERLVDDLEQSLSVQMKFSAPLITQYVGPMATWTLDRKARYDEATQLLIVKYRRLCIEYNAGLLTQEDYAARLWELMEAERKAFDSRRQLIETLEARKQAFVEEADKTFGGGRPDFGFDSDAKRADALRNAGGGERSAVTRRAEEDLAEMATWEQLVEVCAGVRVTSGRPTLEVDVDDAGTRRREVERLDTDQIAQNYRTRLSLHICMFHFGPEVAWTRDRGLEYETLAQELILKSKQLCADFNAGLLSIETYQRRARAIDASVDAAGAVRENIVGLAQSMKLEMRKKAEHFRKR